MRSRRPSPTTRKSTANQRKQPPKRRFRLQLRRAMSISLTESAARHVASYLSKRGKGVGLRLGVRTTGCSGLAYKLEYADEIRPEDHRFESHGVTVLVDPR